MGCDTFYPDINGAARFAERLAAGLVARGHDVHIVAPSKKHRLTGTFIETIEGTDMTVHRWASWRWYPHDWLRFVLPWTAKARARKLLDRVKPDVVHFQSHIVIGRGLAIEAAKRNIRIVGTNHVMAENILDFATIPESWKEWFVRTSWKSASKVFRTASAVTTPTRKAADFLEYHSGLTGVIPVSCGIDASNYTADLAPRTHNRVLFVGRLTTEKQIDVLLKAMAQLPEHLNVTLDIVGGGDQENNLKTLCAKLGLNDRVTFHGRISDDELRRIYTAASVWAMPSIAELQSIATMEAMASGLPVVCADAMALPHLVDDGKNGYLFEPSSVKDLTEKLSLVLEASPERYLEMQKASLEGVRVHDINRTIATFEALYRGDPV
ncbi:glycosyltransferase [Lysinibacter sp. HNR]|uniref:glycosyltransferase n=1 Tax=Lysinibacter sp. HNR TaxID=3031408 RepID=UPI002435B938|nr:glycosyltransferase [Lysinibacter sp. HNR]WGD38687.1 glycosyltransferase [Lysinibacter sp. HNR]